MKNNNYFGFSESKTLEMEIQNNLKGLKYDN